MELTWDGSGVHDYSAQEIAIAAILSEDPELLKAVESGDPYLAFMHRAGLVPDGRPSTPTNGSARSPRWDCWV